ncbi:MAG: polysaccharide biosynthesis tyrosine autokinase [Gemmatimonadetes bacterium]|nr:polysaccharide biosynthesis tyrosine autokinase [Gemmatimonadota bacterium]
MTNDKLPARGTEVGFPPPTWPDQPAVAYDPVGSDPDEGSGLDVGRLVAALLRFKWLIVLMTILGAAGGGVAWTRVDLEYVAGASLWIQGSGGDQGPITGARLLTSSSWIDLLRSFAVLNAVVIENKLYLSVPDTAFEPAFASFRLEERFLPGDYELLYSPTAQSLSLFRDGVAVERKTPGERLGAPVGFDWTPPVEALAANTRIAFSVSALPVVAAGIRNNLVTQMDRNGTFIRVSLRGKDAAEVAATLNAVLDQHVELAAELKSAALEERTSVLEGQLATVEGELRDAERELETFRVSTIALPSDAAMPIQGGIQLTRGPAFQIYNTLKLKIESVRADLRAMERVLADLPSSMLRVEALEVIPAVQTSSQLVTALNELTGTRVQLRTLKQRYTDEHRDVQDLTRVVVALETETVPDLLRSLVVRVRDDEERLQDRIDDATSELGDIPPRTIEESRLQRSVALADRLYGDLRGRYQVATLASASSVPDVRVLDRATPPTKPEVDARLRAALLFLLGGLGAGVGLAILLDRFDTRVRYVSDVTDALGMDILGTIPAMGNGSHRDDSDTRQMTEAFRDLRVSVEFAYGAGKPLALTLTSPEQSEGKSTVATNLAISFAAVGRRTLVIDGDTRRGDLHRMFKVPRKPGLTDFLRGDVGLGDTLRDTEFSGVHLIPSGSRSQSSPELLASGKLGDLLGEFWNRYDVIIVDSPPLGAGADALILGTLTGHLAIVLRTGRTHIDYARAKFAALERLPVRMLGVILNGFVPGRGQGYYAYSAMYIDGYDAVDELDDPEALLSGVER